MGARVLEGQQEKENAQHSEMLSGAQVAEGCPIKVIAAADLMDCVLCLAHGEILKLPSNGISTDFLVRKGKERPAHHLFKLKAGTSRTSRLCSKMLRFLALALLAACGHAAVSCPQAAATEVAQFIFEKIRY